MISVSDSVWREWRSRSADETEWGLLLEFVPVADVAVVAPVLYAAVEAASREGLARAADGRFRRDWFQGEWAFTRASDAVRVSVDECDDFPWMLDEIVRSLDRAGIDASFELWRRPDPELPPEIDDCLIGRVMVRGTRAARDGGGYRWDGDPDARHAVLEWLDRWCRTGKGPARAALNAGAGPVALDAGEPVVDRLEESQALYYSAEVTTLTPNGFRGYALLANTHEVSLILRAGADTTRLPAQIEDVKEFFRECADLLVHGCVWRGWDVRRAMLDHLPTRDWAPIPADAPVIRPNELAFRDLVAPDAYGLQLLGPGYTSRLPHSPRWRASPAGRSSTLLEYADLASWFSSSFVPPRARAKDPELATPALLSQARADLAPLLYRRSSLLVLGFADAEDA